MPALKQQNISKTIELIRTLISKTTSGQKHDVKVDSVNTYDEF